MNWKTAMQAAKGILSGAGVLAGIAAIARSAAFGKALAGYLSSTGSGTAYNGIQSQAAQAASDALGAGMIFYDSVRYLLLFGGVAMICFFGIVLADTLRRRVARLAARLARRLDPEEHAEVIPQQEVLPDGESPIEFTPAEPQREEEPAAREHRT